VIEGGASTPACRVPGSLAEQDGPSAGCLRMSCKSMPDTAKLMCYTRCVAAVVEAGGLAFSAAVIREIRARIEKDDDVGET
jgi:hypothetical protein